MSDEDGKEGVKTLFVLLGPTGVGKTELSFSIAGLLHSPVISADSRQIYREIPIGTAAPTKEQQQAVKHYFIGTRSILEDYSAAQYEQDAMQLLCRLFRHHDNLLLTGGSMLYIDSVCNGIDDLPTVDAATRLHFKQRLETEGLAALARELAEKDPLWARQVDMNNPRRVVHALEICHMTGGRYSSLLGQRKAERPFRIIKIGLLRPREELYERINQRVDAMMQSGLLDEASRMFPYQAANALNTVGYKELFSYFKGDCTLEDSIEKIKRNTRVYSRKQLTWFNRDGSIVWFHPDKAQAIHNFISDSCSRD